MSNDQIKQLEHERNLLGQALGECIEAAGITARGAPLTGPQLLLFAEDLKRLLASCAACGGSGSVYDVTGEGPWTCYLCNGSKVVSTTDTDHNGDHIEMPCPKCGGTGEADSGGIYPNGQPAMIPCDCATEQAEQTPTSGYEQLWGWFGLSYASYAVLPRVMMHAMADGWQGRMAQLLKEWDETWVSRPRLDVHIQIRRNGKICSTPKWLLDYRHPDHDQLNAMRGKEGA